MSGQSFPVARRRFLREPGCHQVAFVNAHDDLWAEVHAFRAVCYIFGNFARLFIAKEEPGLRFP
jgi:hypothetical protein